MTTDVGELSVRGEVGHTFRCMASTVTVRVIDPTAEAPAAIALVEQVFRGIERSCTRFDVGSDLMRANAAADEWAVVSHDCYDVLDAAFSAHIATGGIFDPRMLTTLERLGYDRSWDTMGTGDSVVTGPAMPLRDTWRPTFDPATCAVRIGALPVDLGGIGKGFAVRRAIAALQGVGSAALVEAGGDLATFGDGPHRQPGERRVWRAGVESPFGRTDDAARAEPAAVLDASNAALATSSVRLRSWRSGEKDVHHLIDPRTGEPADSGLAAVTVVADDPAWAEVWTKVGFVLGAQEIADFMDHRGIAALWVDNEGFVQSSPALGERLLWSATRVG